jgi:hypothetical protein
MAMRPRALAVLVLVAALPLARAHDVVPAPKQARPVLLRGGDLYTVSAGVRPATDLLFDQGRIVAIGPDLDAPADAEVVDVRGKRVYPGLIRRSRSSVWSRSAPSAPRTTRPSRLGAPEAAARSTPTPSCCPPCARTASRLASHAGRRARAGARSWSISMAGRARTPRSDRRRPRAQLAAVAHRDRPPRRRSDEQRKRLAEQRRELPARSTGRARTAGAQGRPRLERDRGGAMLRRSRAASVYVAADDYRQIQEAVEFAREVRPHTRHRRRRRCAASPTSSPMLASSSARRDQAAGRDDGATTKRSSCQLHEAGVRFCIGLVSSGGWDVQSAAQASRPSARAAARRPLRGAARPRRSRRRRAGSLDVGKQATLFVSDGDVLDALGQKVTRMWIEGREVDLDNRHKQLGASTAKLAAPAP